MRNIHTLPFVRELFPAHAEVVRSVSRYQVHVDGKEQSRVVHESNSALPSHYLYRKFLF